MIRSALVAVLWLYLPFGSTFARAPAVRSHDEATTIFEGRVDAVVEKHVPTSGPGAAVMVIHQGKILHQKGYGTANLKTKEALGPNSNLRLASVSKQFTAMCVLILADRGDLDLGDSIRDFFPDFPEWAEKVTVRHLLHHTGGLPDYMGLFAADSSAPAEPTSRDVVDLLARQEKPLFQAGERWEYSNSGYVLLAMIVDETAGQPFADFAHENIFEPLGMASSLYHDHREPNIACQARSYSRNLTAANWRDIDDHSLNKIVGDGAVYSNLVDLVRWDAALWEHALVSDELQKEAFTSGKTNDGKDTGYGYGWRIAETLDRPTVGHGGSWVGFRTFILRFLDERLTVVVLCNYAQANPGLIAQEVATVYLEPASPKN